MTPVAHRKPAANRWLANIGSGYADAAVGGVIYIVLTPVLIRSVGVEAYGVWLLSHAITFYLKFFDFGCGDQRIKYTTQFVFELRVNVFTRNRVKRQRIDGQNNGQCGEKERANAIG
mgnify:CR=1 FL=1